MRRRGVLRVVTPVRRFRQPPMRLDDARIPRDFGGGSRRADPRKNPVAGGSGRVVAARIDARLGDLPAWVTIDRDAMISAAQQGQADAIS